MNGDLLLDILSWEKQVFIFEHQGQNPRDVAKLWEARVKSLNTALERGLQDQPDHLPPNLAPPAQLAMVRNHTVHTMQASRTNGNPQIGPNSVAMSRKRSSDVRAAGDVSDLFGTSPDLNRYHKELDYLVDIPTITRTPKMQRTASGRKPMPLQTKPLARNLEHNVMTSKSASASAFPSPRSAASASPFDHSFPNSPLSSNVYSSSFAPHSRRPSSSHPYNMSSQGSLAGLDKAWSRMNITPSSLETPNCPPVREGMVSRQYPTDAIELDPLDCLPKTETGSSTGPINIPYNRSVGNQTRYTSTSDPSNSSQIRPTLCKTPPQNSLLAGGGRSPPVIRNLAPRPPPETPFRSHSDSSTCDRDSPKIVKFINDNGSTTEKYQITRLERATVQKEKLKCRHCNKHPEGFRGPHELQRHVDAQHAPVRKVWICMDASPNQDKLLSCRSCSAQKAYPAYYNAAAHLRRIHFKPTPAELQQGKTGRAGSGGGKLPPMNELKKCWMKEVKQSHERVVDEDDREEEKRGSDDIEALIKLEEEEEEMKEEAISEANTNLSQQASLKAELAVPYLSTTVETAASSFVDISPTDFDAFAANSKSASTLLDTASTAVTIGSNGSQGSLVPTNGALTGDPILMSSDEFDFAELFPDNQFHSFSDMLFDDMQLPDSYDGPI